MAPYQYEPLDSKASEIRLLTLHPGCFSDQLCVSLHKTHISRTSIPHFEALSYVWGSLENLADLRVGTIGDTYVSITVNLAKALPYLRYEDKPRVLWIDAVCIDQQNLKERGHQVQLMRDIYGLASRVVVWLGLEDQDSTYALDLMDELSRKIDVDWLNATMRPSLSAVDEPQWTDLTQLLPYEEKELSALYFLLHRPWFERLWIRQEIRLANPDAIVMCGFKTIRWQSFRNALFCLRQKAKKREHLGAKAVPFHNRIEMIYQMSDDASAIPLGRLLRQTKHCKCSDPRDRIYAMLSILQKSERDMKLEVDYSLTTAEVYQNLVLRYIEHFKSLKILASCEMQDGPPSMPSWVPDWSVANVADPLWYANADAQSEAVASYLGNGILRVCGTVSATLKTTEEILFQNSSNKTLVSAVAHYAPPDVLNGSYVNNGSLLDAYCRTLCCGYFGEEYLQPLAHFPNFEKSKAILKNLINAADPTAEDLSTGTGGHRLLDWFWTFGQGRSFFTAVEGYIGLAPKEAKPGDQVCILLGCPMPLVLRPLKNKRYRVVGECYACGLMGAEAFLGPLPERFESLLKYDSVSSEYVRIYRNIETEQIFEVDPRVEAQSLNRQSQSPDNSSSGVQITPEFLAQRGVIIKHFELE
ncbi:uncharacterized protein PV09_05685 [Verruconis gallopava]|uniref:Heterokaryon incompatibility domain-containing protein n=1 Tax=Verruconis gallopava TaxID=253628 RepID=A0A0D1YR57_9PEZI|nr:uncharacterized protein PV09_05685 [Verruconis gallopava]KIW03032.1 hypothetical protein PV09_05685 [Verruconis gallopava]